MPQFMTSLFNIGIYFKYAVRYRPSCGKPFIHLLKHYAVYLNRLFLFTNIEKHVSWFVSWSLGLRFNHQDFTKALW